VGGVREGGPGTRCAIAATALSSAGMNRAARHSLPFGLVASQHGLLTRAQLSSAGFSRHAIDHLVRSGRLLIIAPGLLVLNGSPETPAQRALAACLDADGALSHRSAAAWWGLPGFRLQRLEVMRLRGGTARRSNLARVHQPRRLEPHHIATWRGLPVTRPARTIFDLAATAHPGFVERTLDTMWSRGLVTIAGLDRMMSDVAARGRTGVVLMRQLIDARRVLRQSTGSRLELRFEALADRAGIPPLRRQVDLGDDEWIGRMDFVAVERRLVVEVDSEIHHAALLDRRRDLDRTRRLVAAGWSVRRYTEDDLWNRGTWVVDDLRAAWWSAPLAGT
jgi:very-short-patch-repair endonuclease